MTKWFWLAFVFCIVSCCAVSHVLELRLTPNTSRVPITWLGFSVSLPRLAMLESILASWPFTFDWWSRRQRCDWRLLAHRWDTMQGWENSSVVPTFQWRAGSPSSSRIVLVTGSFVDNLFASMFRSGNLAAGTGEDGPMESSNIWQAPGYIYKEDKAKQPSNDDHLNGTPSDIPSLPEILKSWLQIKRAMII